MKSDSRMHLFNRSVVFSAPAALSVVLSALEFYAETKVVRQFERLCLPGTPLLFTWC